MSTTMTIRLDDETKARLEKLSESTERSKAFLAGEALREYLDLNEWQIGEIQTGVKEAEQELFASDAEVASVKRKWLDNAG